MISRRRFLALAGGIALLASYPVWIERRWVQINRYQVPVPDLPPAFDGVRIAHLTDVHLGPLVSPSFVQQVIQRTNALDVNLIVCTGDYVHSRDTTQEIDTVWPLLAQLSAPMGVYFVLGNHDHWADSTRSIEWAEAAGHYLRHRSVCVHKGGDELWLGGAGDFYEDRPGIDEAFAASPENACRILLAHNPDTLDTAFDTPLSLTLAGHTHGGQVVLPGWGAPVLPVRNKRYSSGLVTTERGPLFISRGIGWAIYPIRFNCPPEIAVLECVAAVS